MKLVVSLAALVSTSHVTALLFPPPEGPYLVKWDSQELVDHGRLDPWNSSHTRRLMVSRYRPVKPEQCTKTCRVPYMPGNIAKIEDEIIDAFLGPVGWPDGLLATLELELCCKTQKQRGGKFPQIFIGSGFNTTRLQYSGVAQQLASVGYEVIVPDHPYETDVVAFPNGDIIFGGRIEGNLNGSADIDKALDTRAKDVSFIMDRFEVCETVYIGHSFGGPAAATAILQDPRIRGGVNLDGAMLGPALHQGVPRNFLSVGSQQYDWKIKHWDIFFKEMDKKRPGVWSKALEIETSAHGTMQDASIIGDLADLRKNKELEEQFCGNMAGKRAMEIWKPYMSAFIEFVLHGRGEGLLQGPVINFPEVLFTRN